MKLLAINHHYIRRERYRKGIYPVTPLELEENIEKLLTHGWLPLSANEILNIVHSQNPSGEKYFIITFDDGLKCQFTEGMKVLDKYANPLVSAIFFIPTCILEGKELFVHKVHYIRSQYEDEYILDFVYKSLPELRELKISDSILRKQYRYDDLSSARLKYLLNFVMIPEEEKRENLIDSLLGKLIDKGEFINQTYMNSEDVKCLSEKYCIGTHGHTHRPLGQLSYDAAYRDISTSLGILQKITGKEIRIISYPYGGPTAVSKEVIHACTASGLKIGFTMERAVNTAENICQVPLVLSRIDVNDLDEFW